MPPKIGCKRRATSSSSADDYVRNNPWQALGVMAMLGVTLGYCLSHWGLSRRGSERHLSETWTDD